jgi:hypothetical protein
MHRWQHRLDSASTRAGVALVAKDFVAQFSPGEIQKLPIVCRPGKFNDANDVTAYSFLIVRNHRAGGPQAAAFVDKLARFFSSASIRLSQSDLMGPAAPRADRRQSARRRQES